MAGRCALCPHSTSYLSKATTVANLLEKTNPKVLKTPLRAGLKIVHFKTGQHVSRPVDRASTADRATAAAADHAAADRAAAATTAADRAAEANPYRTCKMPPVSAPDKMGFHGSSL